MFNPQEINLSSLPSVLLKDKDNLPEFSGIYFAIDSTGTVQYIGRSVNINQRWMNHHRYSQLEKSEDISIAYLEIRDRALLPEIEETLIDWFTPYLNNSLLKAKPDKKIKKINSTFKTQRLRWKLKEIMARYDIKNIDLAEELGMRPASISHLRKAKTIPCINGDRLVELCTALSKLAGTQITFSDLYEEQAISA